MKQNLHTFIMALLTLFSIYLYFLSANPLPKQQINIKIAPLINVAKEEQEALKYINQLRVGAGLVPFQAQKQLTIAAKNHANYLTHHFKYGHKEKSTDKDFTGEFASSRITYAGYASPQVIENVSTYNHNYKESIDGLFSAIYHRFAFLDFRSDAIGIGISQSKYSRTQTSFVYDMSSNALEELYKSNAPISNKNINKALNKNKKLNAKIVIYPFNQQKNVPPAFFDELPDPLPEHKVSGFPISISFNSLYYKEAKLLNFQLFNAKGVEITNSIKLDKQTDPNQRLGKLDFVLFPLKRLEWDSEYSVKFLAIIDKKIVEKKWHFHTRKFSLPFHTVNSERKLFTLKKSHSYVFYFPPTSKVDLLSDIAYPSSFDIDFIDKNTIKLTALELVKRPIKLKIGKHLLRVNTTQ